MDFLNKLGIHSHWLVRLSLFGTFFFHGYMKFPEGAMMADALGISVYLIYLLGVAEVIGSLLIIIGGFGPELATRFAGGIFCIVMLGAIFTVHAKHGWNSINTGTDNMGMGMEFQILIWTISFMVLTRGNKLPQGE
ncbi:MAG: DoxX family protein [Fidelibacterota bacterium]